VAAGIKKIAVA